MKEWFIVNLEIEQGILITKILNIWKKKERSILDFRTQLHTISLVYVTHNCFFSYNLVEWSSDSTMNTQNIIK